LLGGARIARADGPGAAPTPSASGSGDSAVDEARRHMEKGQALFVEEKFSEAMVEFEAAYKVQPYKAFLYNAAVAAERAGDRERAIARYKEFLEGQPNAPDAPQIRANIERLQKEDRTAPPTSASEVKSDIRSVLIILSEPKGAPATVYERLIPTAPVFDPQKSEQPGWKRVATGLATPADLPLKVGTYHVEVEAFRDFNRSGTDLKLEAGTVYVFKSNLSQGAIVGKLEVKSPVAGAKVYVDDPLHKNAPVGTAPGIIDVAPGRHKLSIEADGFQPYTVEVLVQQGTIRAVQAEMIPEKKGLVSVVTNVDEFTVKIDGVGQGVHHRTDGPFRAELEAGAHQIVVDAKGRHAYASKIDVPGGRELPVQVKLNETGGKGGGVGTAILSAGALAGGITLYTLSGSQTGTDQKNFRIGAGACFGGAAAFAGLSVFLFLYDPSDKSIAKIGPPRDKTPAQAPVKTSRAPLPFVVAPLVSPTAGGAAFVGAF
jgi:hypothetical protein